MNVFVIDATEAPPQMDPKDQYRVDGTGEFVWDGKQNSICLSYWKKKIINLVSMRINLFEKSSRKSKENLYESSSDKSAVM